MNGGTGWLVLTGQGTTRKVVAVGAFRGPVAAAAGLQLALLLSLLGATRTSGAAAAVAAACLVAGWGLLAAALRRHGRERLGPADHVTVTRATLACVVAGLTAVGVSGHLRVPVLVVLAVVALLLDAVDGRVARRTGTVTGLGSRLDMEVDAFLILVLGVAAGLLLGWWVLAIGLLRYAYLAASWVRPWLGDPVPPRYWRKAVAALQGIVLTVATAGLLPRPLAEALAAGALTLLAWSFATQVAELWQRRSPSFARPRGGTDSLATPAAASARALQ